MDQRNCIKFCVKNEIKCARTFEMLTVVLGLLQGPPNTFFLENVFKKNYWIFSQIFFYLKVQYIYTKFVITNPSVRTIDLVSYTTYVVCINFILKWRGLQFKVNSERQISEKLFMAILFTLRVFERNLLTGNRRRNTFRISFWCPAWDSNPGFSSNKTTATWNYNYSGK